MDSNYMPHEEVDAVDNESADSSDHHVSQPPDGLENRDNQRHIKEFISFTCLRAGSTIEWLGGMAAGQYATQELDIPQPMTACAVVAAVTSLEYIQSNYAAKRFSSSNSDAVKAYKRDVVGLLLSSWQGAGATAKYNSTAGLEQTPARRLAQSASYGTAVGIWTAAIPRASEYAKSAFQGIVDRPGQSIAAGMLGSLAVYCMSESIAKYRKRRLKQRMTQTHHQQN